MKTSATSLKKEDRVISPKELFDHLQSHRRLTRRVIEAFPEKDLFAFSIGGMRPFSKMVEELLAISGPGIREIATGEQAEYREDLGHGNSKEKILQLWDGVTAEIDKNWPQIPESRFHEPHKSFGQYEGTVLSAVLYFLENEIHHRGQAYVYLRALGVEPPPFWEH